MPNKIIAANWKLNKTPNEAKGFLDEFLKALETRFEKNVFIFPTTLALHEVSRCLKGRDILFGPQNFSEVREGAFTGETSLLHAKVLGAKTALVGHSERRILFGETDELAAKKIRLASELGIEPILCVGETLKEREGKKTLEVIARQLAVGLKDWPKDKNVIIAYEPVWAIGTGVVASVQQIDEAHKALRNELIKIMPKLGHEVPILYGGSVKPDNANELISCPEVNGFLVGGASLKVNDFLGIIKTVLQKGS